MKSPILFIDHVLFPGQYTELSLSRSVGRALADLWDLEGFGVVEAVVAMPEDPERPAGPGNHAPIAVLAELVVNRGDVMAERTRVRVRVGESSRVRVTALMDAPSGYDAVWTHPFARWESAPPEEGELDLEEDPMARLRRKAVQLFLADPELLTGREDGQSVAEAVVDLAHTDVEPWRMAYLIAELVLDDAPQRANILASDALEDALPVIESNLEMRLADAPDVPAHHTVEGLLADAADRGIQAGIDGLEATRLLAQAGLVDLPPRAGKRIRKLHRELERLQDRYYGLVEDIAEHHAGQGDNEGGRVSDDLTHFDDQGRAHMVDVGEKDVTQREAVALAAVRMAPKTLELIASGAAAKGDVLGVARIAGVMGAKRTAELIPLCHPISLSHVGVAFAAEPGDGHATLWVRATARCAERTGVEMEALCAATSAALTVYDMCKAVDRAMVLERTFLAEKSGGRSGLFTHPELDDLGPPADAEWS